MPVGLGLTGIFVMANTVFMKKIYEKLVKVSVLETLST